MKNLFKNKCSPYLIMTFLFVLNTITVFPKETTSYFEYPGYPMKFLIDSLHDPCQICRNKLWKKSIKLMNKEFFPGRIIISKKDCTFIKINNNELIPSCYNKNEIYKSDPEQGVINYPFVTFRYHSNKNRLIGVIKEDLTLPKFEHIVNKAKIGTKFSAKIIIIKYEYGDGLSYNYSKKSNTLQVHCKIINLKI